MPKVTLDKDAFRALASETRLDILKTLDGTKMNLSELSDATHLNKATLHEHLKKLTETGIVKKIQRPGHKWVYYTLSWKGERLLHPENTKIVITFSIALTVLVAAIFQFYLWAKASIQRFPFDMKNESMLGNMTTDSVTNDSILPSLQDGGSIMPKNICHVKQEMQATTVLYQDPLHLIIAFFLLIGFIIMIFIIFRILWKNRVPQL